MQRTGPRATVHPLRANNMEVDPAAQEHDAYDTEDGLEGDP